MIKPEKIKFNEKEAQKCLEKLQATIKKNCEDKDFANSLDCLFNIALSENRKEAVHKFLETLICNNTVLTVTLVCLRTFLQHHQESELVSLVDKFINETDKNHYMYQLIEELDTFLIKLNQTLPH